MAREYEIARVNESDSGWSLWQGERATVSGKDPGDLLKHRREVVVAVPVAYCTTFSMVLPTLDESLFADMVYAQIDKRGLAEAVGREIPFDFHVVEKKERQVLLSVDVLSADFPQSHCVAGAAAYFPLARLLGITLEHDFVIWCERGRLALAARVNGQVTDVIQLSGSDQLDETLAKEVNLLLLSLQADDSAGVSPRLLVWGAFARDGRTAFEKTLVMPVEYQAALVTSLAQEVVSHMEKLQPLEVRQQRLQKKKAHKRNAVMLAVAVLYVMAGAAVWVFAQRSQKNIEILEQQVEANRPEVREIEAAANRWQELTPAFDLKSFPLVQLNEVTRLMPPSGLVIREFETKGASVRIRGQARDAQVAFQFEEDLASSQFMERYRWNMPQPKVGKNNAASFEIHGEVNDATSE